MRQEDFFSLASCKLLRNVYFFIFCVLEIQAVLVVHSDHRSEPDETEDVNSQQQKWVSPQMKLNDKQYI